jgi:hypothetical protein
MRRAVLLGGLALLAAWSTLQAPLSGDATTHLYLAHSFLVDGDADLSEFADAPQPFVFNALPASGGLYSPYLPGNALLFVPFELAAVLAGIAPVSFLHVAVLAKLAASLAVAGSVALVYRTLRLVARERVALFLTFAYSFGSAALASASQRYWQHGPTLLLVAAVLYVLVRGRGSAAGGARSGLLVGLAVLVRPMSALFGLAVLAFLAHRRRAAVPRFLLWGLPPLAFLVVYDWWILGSPLRLPGEAVTFGLPFEGVLGLLVSPSRGLFVYAPYLSVAFVALAAAWRHPADDLGWLVRYGALGAAATVLLFGSYSEWIGGWGYGNRYLSDLLPLYLLAIAAVWDRWLAGTWARRAFAVAVGWAVLLAGAGAGLYYTTWEGRHWDATPDIGATPWRVWSWTDAQWEWVLARLVLAPPAQLVLEAVTLAGCALVYVRLARRAA